MMRIFVGATLPETTKAEIAAIQDKIKESVPDARIESRDKLHITLQFIGDFPPDKVRGLFDSMKGEFETRDFRSSVTEVLGLNYFPSEKMRRGIWIDCADDGTLAALADSTRSVTSRYGVVPENRSFKAHVTIERFRGEGQKGRSGYADLQKLWSDGKLSIEQFFPESVALFESTLKSTGSEYKVLFDFPLVRDERLLNKKEF